MENNYYENSFILNPFIIKGRVLTNETGFTDFYIFNVLEGFRKKVENNYYENSFIV